jgi:hypothetical protein
MQVLGRAVVVLVVLAASAAGRDIHVDNVSGDDRFTGHSLESLPDRSGPVRTIAKALRLACSGDRIVLAQTDQPYRESISLVGSRHSGLLEQPFVIEGNGAILDGSAPVPPDAWEHYRGAVFRFCPPRTGYQQLFLDDRPAVRIAAGLTAEVPPELKPLQWSLHGGQIFFCVEPGKLPKNYNLAYAHLQTGITLFHVRHVAIVNLTVQGFRIDGINAYNSARKVYFTGVTCRGNGRSGITVAGASQVEIDACLLGNNGSAQLLTLPYSETSVRNSQLFSNTAPAWVDQGGRVFINGKRVGGGIDQDVTP